MNLRDIAVAASIFLMVACGGGGSDSTSSASTTPASTTGTPSGGGITLPTLEGVYAGRLGTRSVRVMVLENNETHFLVGTNEPDGSFVVTGWSFGPTLTNGSAMTTNMQDSTFQGNYDGTNISGTLVGAQGQSIPIAVSKSNVAGYDYNQPAQLGQVAGNWQLQTGNLAGSTLTIEPNGTFFYFGSVGCNATFTLAPRQSGKNVFDANIVTTGSCSGVSLPGYALTYRNSLGGQHFLMLTRIAGTPGWVAAKR